MEEVKINGWNMLDSYKEGQAIYGRDVEITSVSESIQYNVQTFLYGKSGIGKTSLIQAGVFPKLRNERFFPVVIRLAFYDKSSESLNNVIKRLVYEEAERSDSEIGKVPLHHYVIDDTDVSAVSLYDFFSKVCFEDANNEPYIPVLVFDQFEETINNEENWQRTVDFLKEELYDLMDNSNAIHGDALPYTNYRIVFSMREDYLYCLEDIIDQYSLWELRYNRFRIKALDDAKASGVIRKTSGISGLEEGKEDLIVNTIIKIVKLNSGTRFTEINTALLSLVCSLLYDNSEDNCIRYKDLRNINSYLRSYYDDICNKIGSKATHYLEGHLLTKDGRRSSMDESEAINSGKISQESLDYLVEKRLLRKIKTDSTSNRYEYIHDLFAKMVYKRLQEDKSKWFYPELRTLSRKEDRSSFLRKIILASLCVIGFCCCIMVIHSKSVHSTWKFWDLSICRSNFLYYYPFVLSVYLLPIVTKRLHDVNKSGWLCFAIPISAFLINIDHVIPELAKVSVISTTIGYLLIGYLLYLCLKTSINNTKPRGFSREYESVFNMAPITNVEFAKSLSVELLWWCICCCLTDMLLYSYYNNDIWSFFYFKNNVILLEKIGLTISLPAAIALLPLIISASPALRARVKSIGYPIWISFIPFLNVLLLVEGLFPDDLLMKIKLINANKGRNRQESDNIFAEISDDFTVNEDILYTNHLNERLNEITRLFMLLVPLYGTIKGLDKSQKIGIRVSSMAMGLLNALLIWGLFFYLGITGYLDSVTDIWAWLILIFVIVIYVIPLIGMFVLSRNQKKKIFCVIKEHPYYSINQIAHELVVKPSALEKEINKMKEKGEIERVEEGGQLIWKVNKPL